MRLLLLLMLSLSSLVPIAASSNAVSAVSGGRAVQLVRPDGSGGIEVVNDGLDVLASLGEVHIVTVVGGYHTGKSFLLNQLMGQGQAFTIGPSTSPTTQGMWLWSQPAQADGVNLPILFIDTEGFSAPDRTANYDSKIFANAVLLSSHVLYNSVRIIDQREIEHLEVLTRLTQLFSVKTALQDNSTAMHFPGLTWVVEDFVADLQTTPKKWLEELLEARTLGEGAVRGLAQIFASIDCKTLFIPTLKSKRMLAHLDEASTALTAEYVDDLKALTLSIVESLKHKESLGETRSGRSAAGLLKLLVSSANEGRLAEVPSMWDSFLKLQVQEALRTAEALQVKELNAYNTLDKPLATAQYSDKVQASSRNAVEMYQQMLVGLNGPDKEKTRKVLLDKLDAQGKGQLAQNKERIRIYITRETEALVETFRTAVSAIEPIPMASKTLNERLSELTTTAESGLKKVTDEYVKVGSETFANRQRELGVFTSEKVLENKKALHVVLDAAQKSAHHAYDVTMERLLHSRGEQCVQDKDMEAGDTAAVKQSMEEFEVGVGVAAHEDNIAQFRSHTREGLRGLLSKMDARNGQCITKRASKVRQQLAEICDKAFRHMSKPLEPTQLELAIQQEVELRMKSFDSQLQDFAHSYAVSSMRRKLLQNLEAASKAFRVDNERAVQTIVRIPLEEVREEMERHIGGYWTAIGFKRDCRFRAKEMIAKRGSLSPAFASYLDNVIERWIDEELTHLTAKLRIFTYVMYGTPVVGIAVAAGAALMAHAA